MIRRLLQGKKSSLPGSTASSGVAPERVIRVTSKEGFKETYRAFAEQHPAIKARIKIFNELKRLIPPGQLPAEMNDARLNAPLEDYRHCHLGEDIILIYTHEGDDVTLYTVCQHDELTGKRAKSMAKRLDQL